MRPPGKGGGQIQTAYGGACQCRGGWKGWGVVGLIGMCVYIIVRRVRHCTMSIIPLSLFPDGRVLGPGGAQRAGAVRPTAEHQVIRQHKRAGSVPGEWPEIVSYADERGYGRAGEPGRGTHAHALSIVHALVHTRRRTSSSHLHTPAPLASPLSLSL